MEFVTGLHDNNIGKCAMMENQKRDVGINRIIGGERLGIYFLEIGAVSRGSKVIYDQAHPSIFNIKKDMID